MSEPTGLSSFSDALKSTPPPEAPPEAAPAVETTPVEAAPEAPVAEATAPVTPETAPEVASSQPPEDWQKQANGFKQAMIEERRKRQEIEARLQAMQQPPPKPVDYFEDPQQYVAQTVGQVEKSVETKLLGMSEMMARQAHADYQEKFNVFQEAVRVNPALYEQVRSSANPGEEVYQMGKSILFYKEYGNDPETILKNAEAKLKPKIRAEVEQEFMGKVAQRNNQPTNILDSRAASGDNNAWRPSSFADALPRRKR